MLRLVRPIGMDVGYDLSDLLGVAVALVCAGFIVRPLMVLAHELGHAVLALRFAPGLVQVHVGRPPGRVRIGRRRLRVEFSPEPARGVSFGGVTIFASRRVTPLQSVAIAAAGPTATMLVTVALAAGAVLTAGAAPLAAWTLGLSAFEGALSL